VNINFFRRLPYAALFFCLLSSLSCSMMNSSVTPEQRKQLEDRFEKLDFVYDIVQKDHPTNQDTILYRRKIAEAQKALGEGDYESAVSLTNEAQRAILNARKACYDRHVNMVIKGESNQTNEELLWEAKEYKRLAEKAERMGNDWEAEMYYQASVEQGSLALMACRNSENVEFELVKYAKEMEMLLEAAGETREAEAIRRQMENSLQRSLNELSREINVRLEGRARGYTEAELKSTRQAFVAAKEDLQEIHQVYKKFAESAENFAPEKFDPPHYSARIINWSNKWEQYWKNPESNKIERFAGLTKEEAETVLAQHNEIKEGARSTREKGVVVREEEIVVFDDLMMIKGTFQNSGTEPIFNPRIVACGMVISNPERLGYNRIMPGNTASFEIMAMHFMGKKANNKNVPEHQLVVIYDDIRGQEVKVLHRSNW